MTDFDFDISRKYVATVTRQGIYWVEGSRSVQPPLSPCQAAKKKSSSSSSSEAAPAPPPVQSLGRMENALTRDSFLTLANNIARLVLGEVQKRAREEKEELSP